MSSNKKTDIQQPIVVSLQNKNSWNTSPSKDIDLRINAYRNPQFPLPSSTAHKVIHKPMKSVTPQDAKKLDSTPNLLPTSCRKLIHQGTRIGRWVIYWMASVFLLIVLSPLVLIAWFAYAITPDGSSSTLNEHMQKNQNAAGKDRLEPPQIGKL